MSFWCQTYVRMYTWNKFYFFLVNGWYTHGIIQRCTITKFCVNYTHSITNVHVCVCHFVIKRFLYCYSWCMVSVFWSSICISMKTFTMWTLEKTKPRVHFAAVMREKVHVSPTWIWLPQVLVILPKSVIHTSRLLCQITKILKRGQRCSSQRCSRTVLLVPMSTTRYISFSVRFLLNR